MAMAHTHIYAVIGVDEFRINRNESINTSKPKRDISKSVNVSLEYEEKKNKEKT